MPDIAVQVEDLHKSFGSVHALRGVSFEAKKGTVLGVLGPNGAGKTTTIKILSTLLVPDSGSASVAGFDLKTQSAEVRRSIMMTGQFAALDYAMNARDNLILFGRLMGLRKGAAKARAEELLTQFDLQEAADRQVLTYSGGMRRRIDLACGLVVRPQIVYLDEPTTGLDPRSRQAVWSLVSSLKDEGITVLLTTQYLEEADVLADEMVVIDRGQVIASGTSDELKAVAGGTHLVIDFLTDADEASALKVLNPIIPRDADLAAQSPGTLSIPAPEGPVVLAEAVRLLDTAGIRVADIGLRRPTLDDVFLSLTHRQVAP